MQFPPVEEQLAILRRGIEKIVPEEELAQKLKKSRDTGTPLRVKYGIDPTGISVHLGHTVPMRKIRQFQELGHQAVIIIGNYTALVGDPSGRDEARTRLTEEKVEANARDYLVQVGKVIDMSKAEVVRNGDWFSKMSFLDVLELCSRTTLAQLLTREDFAKRFKEERPIFLHECLYPLMQGWDSVKIRADVELGGTEQLYTFMLTRDLQKEQGQPQQVALMSPILVGTDGVRRMGKSLGNFIGISEPPYDMMKKFMQLPDSVMKMYFELLTEIPVTEIEKLLAGHPKEAKLALARDVIGQYNGSAAAEEAASRWQREISDKAMPENIETVTVRLADVPPADLTAGPPPAISAGRLLVVTGLCKTTSESRRVISQGGAYLGTDKQPLTDYAAPVKLNPDLLLWVGKKRIVRVKVQ